MGSAAAPNPSTALARVLVDELARGGLTDLVLAPGSRSAPVALAAHAHAELRVHVRIDERSAAFCALGMARVTRRAAAVLCTSGTAAANFHPAVIEADRARIPLVVLTADRPPELRDVGANQTIDQRDLYGRAVRWFVELGPAEVRAAAPAQWRSTVAQLLARAHGAPAGPVQCNLALREPLVPTITEEPFPHPLEGRAQRAPWTAAVPAAPALPAPPALDALAGELAAVERGLLVAGDCDLDDPGPVCALAEALGWPLIAEPLSGARAGPAAISTAHLLLGHAPFAAAHRPELVLRLGRVALSRPVLAALDAARQIVVDPDGWWADPGRGAARQVTADPAALCGALAARLAPRAGNERPQSGGPHLSDWRASWQRAEQRARAALDAALDADDAPSEPRAARDVADLVPDGGLLVAGSSMPVRDLDLTMRPRTGLRVIGNRGASGIDGFVSTAVGAALVHPGPVVALAGDLSLLHDQNGLLVRDGSALDLTIVVVNNDGGGIFSLLPQAELDDAFEHLFGTPHGRDLAALAAFSGCGHQQLARADELGDLLAEARARGGLQLVELRTERAANAALHRDLQQTVAASL